MSTVFDFIIVGGGSAGCVLANRLSAHSANRVLLCEAGEDTPDGHIPEAILNGTTGNAARNARFLWNELLVSTEATSDDETPRLVNYEQARVMGGGSSINGQLANRGSPADYDEWEMCGVTGWRWETVLPYFKKIERDIDFDGPLHGSDGRIPVSRVFPDNWSNFAKAAGQAMSCSGYSYLPDQNGVYEDGYYPLASSSLYDTRISAAMGYLGATVRLRPNLTISANTHVRDLLFDGSRCVGVRAVMADGQEIDIRGREVIVCGGAIHSPAILLRSGIGPVEPLRKLGIPIQANVPGVGHGLTDHPSISVAAFLKPPARTVGKSLLMGLRFSSDPQQPNGDMAVTVTTGFGGRIAIMTLCVNKTFSQSGQVRLTSADWRVEPRVDFNLLNDRRDLTRLMAGFRHVAALYNHPALQAVTSDPFPASFTYKARKVSEINLKSKIITAIGARLLDGPGLMRRFMIRNFIMESEMIGQLLHSDDLLEAYIRRATVGVWHASCSCRMGSNSDPMTVTNASGQVRNVSGLRVVDASIFPTVPCANTNFPTMMVAEKIAEDILNQQTQQQFVEAGLDAKLVDAAI